MQLKGSDLELTIVKGSSTPLAALNGPACAYVNLRVKLNGKEQGRTEKRKKTTTIENGLAVACGALPEVYFCTSTFKVTVYNCCKNVVGQEVVNI